MNAPWMIILGTTLALITYLLLVSSPWLPIKSSSSSSSRGNHNNGTKHHASEQDESLIELLAFTLAPAAVVPSRFVSFTFDWNINVTEHDAWSNASVGWTLDLDNPRLKALARAMAPANLRVGGSPADEAVYLVSKNNQNLCSSMKAAKHVCLNMNRWEQLVKFCQDTGVRLIFTLNIMFGRDADTSQSKWEPSNIRQFLEYTAQRWPSFPFGFEIGNEKEMYLDPVDVADCYRQVRSMINKFWPTSLGRPILVGPAMNVRPDWLRLFLSAVDYELDAVTYHLYPGYGPSLNLTHLFLSPAWLDWTHTIVRQTQRAVLHAPKHGNIPELWVGESAAAWASGASDGICNGFMSSFWYLDTLGHLASTGHGAHCRQALVGGNYSLLDQLADFQPNPDYWAALLFRRLVTGSSSAVMLNVLQATPGVVDFDPRLRTYLACTPPSSPYYTPGAMTLIWINTDDSRTLSARLRNASTFKPHEPFYFGLPRWDFVLTSSHLRSRTVQLNGQILRLQENDMVLLPPLKGVKATDERLILPPQSMGFSVFTSAKVDLCLSRFEGQGIIS